MTPICYTKQYELDIIVSQMHHIELFAKDCLIVSYFTFFQIWPYSYIISEGNAVSFYRLILSQHVRSTKYF